MNRRPPDWACDRYGDYEHDWLDCPSCVKQYEQWLEDSWNLPPTVIVVGESK